MKAQRFAEGGSNDLGDIQLFVDGEEYFIEAKSRQNLNLHQSLGKAIEKSSDENTVLFWKKLKRQGCLLYTSPSPRDRSSSRMPSSA